LWWFKFNEAWVWTYTTISALLLPTPTALAGAYFREKDPGSATVAPTYITPMSGADMAYRYLIEERAQSEPIYC
jgi:hypothetical protein